MPQRCVGEPSRRGGGICGRHRKTDCPSEFTMIKTFIGDSKERNGLRPNIASNGCLPSTIKNHVFVGWNMRGKLRLKG